VRKCVLSSLDRGRYRGFVAIRPEVRARRERSQSTGRAEFRSCPNPALSGGLGEPHIMMLEL
jgi:hypothetical protein